MGKEDIIMVVKSERLFGDVYPDNIPQGFLDPETYDFTPEINTHHEWMRRGHASEPDLGGAEVDNSYKQPIVYMVIVNPLIKKVFAYQRSATEGGESRLAGNWTWGVGGHVDDTDKQEGDEAHHVILRSSNRELDEEVEMITNTDPKFLFRGYINDDRDSVGAVHIGLLHIVETDANEINPRASEIATGRYMDLSELEDLYKMSALPDSDISVEGWSGIALEPLRKYFDSLK
jgi:predicted NUDIX family phosphoesterase